MAAAVALGVPRRSVSAPPMGLAQTPWAETAQAGMRTTMPAQTVPLPPNTVPPPTAPPAQSFTGVAPRPTPYGDFTAPDPTKIASDPYYQFRLSEGLKQQQRGAASRGTLLTGGFQKALTDYGQGLASEESGKAFDRALQTYDTNRSTNAQNFGQGMESYQGSLAGFNANTNATLGYGRLGLDTQEAQYGQGRQNRLDTQANQQSQATAGTLRQAQIDDDFARQVEAERQRNALTTANSGRPVPVPRLPIGSRTGR